MIPDISSQHIIRALTDFDTNLRDSLEWRNWEDNKAHKYAIKHDGRLYPVKMIVELATGRPRSEFSGGDAPGQAAAYIREREFEVIRLRSRNPTWTRDELILALDLYLHHQGSPPPKDSDEIIALSRDLNAIGQALGIATGNDFRNANGVYMKLMNFRRLDPGYTGQGKVGLSRGGKLEAEVWAELASEPRHCHEVAEAIRGAASEVPATTGNNLADDEVEAEEGRLLTVIHRRRERSRKIVEKKKQSVLSRTGRLVYEACGFDFQKTYGERGAGFIECHHTQPVSESTGTTKLSDLALVCANCHRMIHAKRPWLTVEEVSNLLSTWRPGGSK